MPRGATFAHAHNRTTLNWRPTPRQVMECLVFRLMRAAVAEHPNMKVRFL